MPVSLSLLKLIFLIKMNMSFHVILGINCILMSWKKQKAKWRQAETDDNGKMQNLKDS